MIKSKSNKHFLTSCPHRAHRRKLKSLGKIVNLNRKKANSKNP